MAARTAFITGIAGFAGSYLAEQLLAAGYHVSGALYPGESTTNLTDILDDISLTELDILDAAGCRDALNTFKPYFIFHLAALASVGKSFANERLTFRVNFEGTLNILQAAMKVRNLKRLVFVGSPDCFGIFRPKNKTLTEDHPFNPVSPYGISKAAADRISLYYWRQHNLPVVVARPFNHSGPRQAEDFVIPAFARQVATIEAGLQKPLILVGDLTARRDLSDVRDIVRGYQLIAEKGRPGRTYHLCSGRAVAIETVLDSLLKLSSRKIKVTVDKSRLRKSEIPVLRGSNRRAVQELGYKPRYSLQTTLKDTLEYWRSKLPTAAAARTGGR